MINVKNNIKFNSKYNFIEINISIIIHLGKNPTKGGRPPKDNKGIKIIIFNIWLLENNLKIWFKLKSLKLLNIKIIETDKKI